MLYLSSIPMVINVFCTDPDSSVFVGKKALKNRRKAIVKLSAVWLFTKQKIEVNELSLPVRYG